jgi:hypothetical protein
MIQKASICCSSIGIWFAGHEAREPERKRAWISQSHVSVEIVEVEGEGDVRGVVWLQVKRGMWVLHILVLFGVALEELDRL